MTKLYKPIIAKKVIDDEHYYYVDGDFRPSVTRILGATLPMPYALRKWIGDVGTEKAQAKLEKAGDRGSRIHDTCERLLVGQKVKLYKEYTEQRDRKCIASFITWVNEVKPKYENKHIEFTVASRMGYAGTLDLFCEIDGEPYIIDFKTSGGVYDSHILQITAYQQAFYEMTGIRAKRAILHLNPRLKRGYSFIEKMEIKKREVQPDDFKLVLEMYKMLNGGVVPEPPKIDMYPEIVSLFEEVKEDG